MHGPIVFSMGRYNFERQDYRFDRNLARASRKEYSYFIEWRNIKGGFFRREEARSSRERQGEEL